MPSLSPLLHLVPAFETPTVYTHVKFQENHETLDR
jgi:hypothetical protein